MRIRGEFIKGEGGRYGNSSRRKYRKAERKMEGIPSKTTLKGRVWEKNMTDLRDFEENRQAKI